MIISETDVKMLKIENKTLIFDFDGTLVDSMGAWAGKMLSVLEKNGITPPKDIIKIITPLGDRGSALYFIEQFGIEKSPEELISEMDEYAIPEYSFNIPAKAGVLEALSVLKKQGYSLNVLTASPHRMLDICLERVGLSPLFDNVWSCDDFGTTKSDVNIYHSVSKKLGTVTEKCTFFDDNINALRVAKASGMTVIGVYDKSSADSEEEIRALSDGFINGFSELI